MVNARKKETERRYRKWNPENMLLAIEAVRLRKMSRKAAAKLYSIPRSTLLDRYMLWYERFM